MYKLTLCILIGLTFTVSDSHGGDTSSSALIGFSKDGTYAAFERFGTYDGSGFPYHEIFILDVDKNRWAVKPLVTMNRDDEGGQGLGGEKSASRMNYKKANQKLLKYGIIKGNVGRKIASMSQDGAWVKTLNFKAKNISYQLVLKEIDTGQNCYSLGTAKIFELGLICKMIKKILQKDRKIPHSRECPLGYRIDSAHIYKNKIAVFIEYQKPGFEGPDTRQIFVTGAIQ